MPFLPVIDGIVTLSAELICSHKLYRYIDVNIVMFSCSSGVVRWMTLLTVYIGIFRIEALLPIVSVCIAELLGVGMSKLCWFGFFKC